MTSLADVEEEVFRVLGTLIPRGTVIKPDQWLLADLKLLSDDATQMIIDLERHYHIKTTQAEWNTVLTVQDTIDVIARHVVK